MCLQHVKSCLAATIAETDSTIQIPESFSVMTTSLSAMQVRIGFMVKPDFLVEAKFS